MKVEIYSDVICPWCSIGKARFEKALTLLPAETREKLTYVWKPYQLDPTAPSTPTPVIEGYARKFGGHDRARQIIDTVTEAAAGEGITFNMEIGKRANTLDAHRLIWMALEDHGPAIQDVVNAKLFDAYFREGRNVAELETLVAIAGDAGMDAERVAADLAGSRGRKEVLHELAEAANMGITAVPTFVIDGEWSIPGAQDPETFVRVFERLAAKQAEREALASGTACAVDDPDC